MQTEQSRNGENYASRAPMPMAAARPSMCDEATAVRATMTATRARTDRAYRERGEYA